MAALRLSIGLLSGPGQPEPSANFVPLAPRSSASSSSSSPSSLARYLSSLSDPLPPSPPCGSQKKVHCAGWEYGDQ